MGSLLSRHVLFLISCCTGLTVVGQRWALTDTTTLMAAIVHNQTLYMRMETYWLDGTLSAFRDIRDVTAAEREPVEVWKTKEGYKATHLGLTTLQNAHLRVLIDPGQRRILLSKPTDMLDMVDAGLRSEVFATTKALERRERPDGVHFRLTFPKEANYASLELVFDAKGWLRQMITCWGHPVQLDPENPLSATVTPKTVLELGVPQPLRKPVDTDPGQAVVFTKEGPMAKGLWNGFQVLDTRVQ